MQSTQVKMQLPLRLSEAKKKKPGMYEAILMEAGMSLNKHYFSEEVIAQAAHMFEGAPMYIDHPRTPADEAVRSMRDLAGRIQKTWMEGSKLMAEIKISESAGWVASLIEEDIGGDLSVYVGALTEDSPEGYTVVGEITAVGSVDFVSQGAIPSARVLQVYEAFISNHSPMTLDELKKNHPQALEEAKKEFTGELEAKLAEHTKIHDESEALQKTLEEANTGLKTEVEALKAQIEEAKVTATHDNDMTKLLEGIPASVNDPLKNILKGKTLKEATMVVEALRKELAAKQVSMAAPIDGDGEGEENVVAQAFGLSKEHIEAVRSVHKF
jgi:hypothetical protein